MKLFINYYHLNRLQLFIIIVSANLIIVWLSKNVLINEIVFYNTFRDQLSYDRSGDIYKTLKSLVWINYVFMPVILFIKFTLVTMVLYIGVVVFNLQNKISLGSIFKVVIASEIIFVLANLIRFLWFFLFGGNYDLNDISFFYPLSVINLFKIGEIDKIWIWPMQMVNLFQVLYILAIAYGLNRVCELKKTDSEKIVLISYLPALLIWVSLIMFLSIDTMI